MKEIIKNIRKDFPYLEKYNNELIYFDNAATTQKPKFIIDELSKYYFYNNGNPHRGAHRLAVQATELYEESRNFIAEFINASSPDEILFVRNATEALNLISSTFGEENIKENDEILISIMEHHSNLVPWQELVKKKNATLKYLYLDEDYEIKFKELKEKLNKNTKIFSITGASNVVGTIPDIKKFIKYIRENYPNIIVIIDGSQLVPHEIIDVREIDCDFLVFSGHKMIAPMGIGVLYGKKEILNNMSPYMYGGDMIEYVYEQDSTYLPAPARFEAGTQNVGGAYALKKAIEYMQKIGFDFISEYERELSHYCYNKMKNLSYLEIYSSDKIQRSPLIAFNYKQAHPHDVASILDTKGIAIRSGHHCAQPLHRSLGNSFSCRASFAFYNTKEEIDYFIDSLEYVRKVMGIES